MARPAAAAITLLGRCSLCAGTPPQAIRLSSKKAWALLAYVAMQPGRTANRAQLATLLWGDRVDTQARHSLRQCLVSLRQDLTSSATDLLVIEADEIRLPESVTVDALEFLALAESRDPTNPERAVALYGGPFLADLDINDEAFNDWVQTQRSRLEEAAARVFETWAAQADSLGRGQDALETADRLLALDPMREDWQRMALRIYARHRSREAALAQAKKFSARLKSELGVDPEPATLALIEEIKRCAAGRTPQEPLQEAATLAPGNGDAVRTPSNEDFTVAASPPVTPALHSRVRRDWYRQPVVVTSFLAALVGISVSWLLIAKYPVSAPPGDISRQVDAPAGAVPPADDPWRSPGLVSSASVDMPALAEKAIVPIVILPFTAMAGIDSADQATADIVTEDLINRLSRFREMRVIARNTAWFYRGRPVDVAAVGTELGIRYAVEGSVRSQGEILRLNIQLIDAGSRLQVWSDLFEREQANLFAVQDEIVKGLARALQVQLMQAQSRGADERSGEPAVAALVARGQTARYRGRTLENLTEALALYEEAHRRDPELVPAMVGLAATSVELVSNYLVAEPAPYLQRAETLLQRVLQKDPDYPGAYYQLGLLQGARGQHEAALQSYARAVELNPSLPFAHASLAVTLTRIGRASEAMPYLRYAMRLSPKDPSIGYWYLFAGETELELGNNEAALEWLLRALAQMPKESPLAHGWLAATYALNGDHPNAAKHLAELKKVVPATGFSRWKDMVKRNSERREGYRRRLHEGLALAFASSQ